MQETGLKIRLFGDPALRKRAVPVKKITASHRHILKQMAQLMYDHSGVGLAAPQVGIDAEMIVADAGSGLYKLINPRILKKQGFQALEEGCLSLPGVCIKVKRANKILVRALDEDAQPVEIEAEGLLSCIFQHEIDHLRGKLIIDYAALLDKLKLKKKLQMLEKRTKDEELSESEKKSCQLQL